MKNNSTLAFYTLLITCFVSLATYSQTIHENKSKDFNLKVIEYSQKPDLEKTHYHLLSLENKSNKESRFNISVETFEVINSEDIHSSNITAELYNESLTEGLSTIALPPNSTIKFKLKTSQNSNAKMGSRNYCKITASSIHKNETSALKINSNIPNPNFSGN